RTAASSPPGAGLNRQSNDCGQHHDRQRQTENGGHNVQTGDGRRGHTYRRSETRIRPPRARSPVTQALEGFLQALSAGLLIGAVYGLMGVGLGLIFGVRRVSNFAQGDFMMRGMYAAFYFFTALGVQATFGNTFG